MSRPVQATKTSSTKTSKRSFVISILGALALLLLALTIFAVASQSRTLSVQVEQAVQTGETLRVASIARAELSVASRVAEAAPNELLVIQGALGNATEALNSVEAGMVDLGSEEIRAAFADFRDAADAQATQITEFVDDAEGAQEAELVTGEAFAALAETLRAEQVANIEGLEADNDLMNLIATVATFIVAFVVPSMGLMIFQALRNAPRELRRLQLEHDRVEARSQTMASAIAVDASRLRSELLDTAPSPERDSVLRSLLRFESIAAFNGSPTSVRNEQIDINSALVETIEQIDSESVVEVEIDDDVEWLALGDREHFGLVIAELATNAIAYGAIPVEVWIEASRSGDLVELHVVDGGPGLPDGVAEAALHEHEFGLREDTSRGSYGFGLIAARRALEAMGGTLSYKRTDGRTHLIAALPMAEGSVSSSGPEQDSGELPLAA